MKELSKLPVIQEIICDLTAELKKDSGFDAQILSIKVKDAYRDVKSRRCYQYSSLNKEQIEQDMYDNYYSYIKNMALYKYNTIGGEFEVSHSENGISRTWRSEDDILKGIIPFVKVM